jgi:hypothetical protein
MALIFTILPFSMAAPFIGPLIDRARGGRKWMIVGLSAGRALVCALLVWDRNTPWALYPQFLFALVFAKGYVIAKGALVPTTVHNDAELVQANAKLAAISGVAAVAGGAPSLLVMWIASKLGSDHGPDFALAIATVVYVFTAIQAAQLPSVRIADEPADEAEITELRTAGIRHAAQAISLTRGTVGFLTFMLAFHFKNLEAFDSTASKIGLVGSVVGGQLGFMVGAAIAPPIRRQLSEERMLMVSLGTITVAGLLTALMGELAGATLLAFGVGITSNTAKQAFDAIVQRDAPDANRGRAFARFETRFQLVWVTGALIPVAIAMPIKLGFLLIAVCCGTALTLYYVGLHRAVAESKRRTDEGSRVHTICDHWASTGVWLVPEDDIKPYIDSFRAFVKEYGIRPADYELLEARVINRTHGYAGTLDAALHIFRDRSQAAFDLLDRITGESATRLDQALILVDYKSREKPERAVFMDQPLQLAGYRFAETIVLKNGTEVPMFAVDATAIIQIRPDKTTVELMLAEQPEFEVFLALLEADEWALDRGKRAIGARTFKYGEPVKKLRERESRQRRALEKKAAAAAAAQESATAQPAAAETAPEDTPEARGRRAAAAARRGVSPVLAEMAEANGKNVGKRSAVVPYVDRGGVAALATTVEVAVLGASHHGSDDSIPF